jgi:hypothetical protein
MRTFRLAALAFAILTGNLTAGCPGAPGDGTPDDDDAPEPTPTPAHVCPPELTLPETGGCDGVDLTDPASSDGSSGGIATVPGPGAMDALRIEDGQWINIVDQGCLQLGKDGADFSLSLVLQAWGSSQIIGTKSQYNNNHGFLLFTRVRDDGRLELIATSSPAPSGPKKNVVSTPFDAGTWVRATLRYRNEGDQSRFWLSVNGEARSGGAYPDVHNPFLRIGDEGWGSITAFELAELRSFGRLLSDGEVRSLFRSQADALGFSLAELAAAIGRISAHVEGTTPLDSADLDAEHARFAAHAPLLTADETVLVEALDLVDRYESTVGPLFVDGPTRAGFPRSGSPGDGLLLERTMLSVQQQLVDRLLDAPTVRGCRRLLDGRGWATAEYFPGAAPPPEDPDAPRVVTVRAEAPAYWGRPVAFATDDVRRPTGHYLSPGSVGRVTVPEEMVGAGYSILVGAHTADHSNKGTHKRLDRVSATFAIEHTLTHIANPLGGGVYLQVPYLADLGLVEIELRGVIEAPFFSARSFHGTSATQWEQRRRAPAPWADYESDKYMMQVPSSWIFASGDPTPLMRDWDLAMDGVSELLGYPPEERNRTVLYQQVDVHIRHGVFGIGYPQINNPYDPHRVEDGDKDHWLLTEPTAWEVDYHELGHAQLMSMFPGETEAIVNFPHAYVRNVKFGVDFDTAFQQSFGPAYGDVGFAPDDAAIHWMVSENFRNGRPMDRTNSTHNEFRYQQRGYAKYADIARTFDWQVLRDFYHQEHLDHMADAPGDGLASVDSRILRLSVAAGADLTPLIHFWGIHPEDASALANAIITAGLPSSTGVRDLLVRYNDIAPADNAEFNAHFERVYPGRPPGGDPDYGVGWYNVWRDQWSEVHAAQITAALQDLLDLYFPGTEL